MECNRAQFSLFSGIVIFLLGLGWYSGVSAAESPTINPPSGASDESYTEKIRKELDQKAKEKEKSEASHSSDSYINDLQRENPNLKPKAGNEVEESYSEKERKKLAPKSDQGAIQATLEGKSELKEKKVGNISRSFGLRYGLASLTKEYSYGSGAPPVNFNELYGKNYAPDASLFYEIQFFHSESLGSLGLVGLAGVGYNSGTGVLSKPLNDPRTGGTFSSTSQTNFQFFSFPAAIALNYRLNLLNYVRPYLMIGPSAVGYWEQRSDASANNFGLSSSLYMSGGVAFLLDWISKSSDWGLYFVHGIHHTYITVDYIQLVPIGGFLRFASSGIFAGLTFEY